MSSVWRVSRAAVRRRRFQTTVIGLVVGISTATIVVALGLLASASAPFDRAHTQQSGAHLVVAFDGTAVSGAALTRAAEAPEVEAVAGPFGQVSLDTSAGGASFLPPSLTTVGRADPGGPVDRLNVWQGRWATEPGEIVLNVRPGISDPVDLGTRVDLPGGVTLTVVGFAYSVSGSADAWVTPDQLAALHPTDTEMLYRFTDAATEAQVSAGAAAVTAGLPPNAVLGSQSYLTLKQRISSEAAPYIPFLVVFGLLGLVVAVLIVGNVISGAVVAGFRHIGVLKAIGFTPNQVMAVYLVMVTVPSVIGCVLGTVLGNIVGRPMLSDAFSAYGSEFGIDLWVDAVALLGTPAVVALAALLSALRARGLPAAEAISAGSSQRVGRALAVQRWLSGTRLPRSVSLGLGVPFARPARSALTLAAVVLGVTTVTLAIGVTMSVTAYNDAMRPAHPDRIEVLAGMPADLPVRPGGPEAGVEPQLSDGEDEALLRSLPGAVHVAAVAGQEVEVVGGQRASVQFYRGEATELAPQVLEGR
ncbi:MAG: FtsX-like permease family protein [Actinophytocola sp.]|uniref:ABC transporter permease n=1 Tax=Actinophytocola sp. TaxID=1872138 RepID=UPI0013210F59|nr:FtsX-like permease family protein [Actinophytocola sp.]MPZ84840.1 FtsX-like permease family protein [Actinophytocola sp.]